jgi:hypothetical protein
VSGADDPGWGFALRALIPIVGLRYRAQRAPDGLTALRSVLVGLVAALPLFAVSLSYVVEKPASPGPAPFVVVTVGLLSALGISLLRDGPSRPRRSVRSRSPGGPDSSSVWGSPRSRRSWLSP